MINPNVSIMHRFHCICYSMFVPQQDVELPIPRYIIGENTKVLKEREKMLGTILARMGPEDGTATEVCITVCTIMIVINFKGLIYVIWGAKTISWVYIFVA